VLVCESGVVAVIRHGFTLAVCIVHDLFALGADRLTCACMHVRGHVLSCKYVT
jgi:hypothetical protein